MDIPNESIQEDTDFISIKYRKINFKCPHTFQGHNVYLISYN